jgi:ribose transport system substrate-binding protein
MAAAACGSDTKAESTAAPAAPTSAAASTTAPSVAPADSTAPTETKAPDTTVAPADSAAPECDAKGKVVGYSEPLPDPNFALIESVIQSELDKVGAELKPVNANLDPGKQIADIQSLQQGGIDVLIVNPVDPNAVIPAMDAVRADNIPIVAQDTEVGGPFFVNVAADIEDAAKQGADYLKAKVGDGQVAAINGPAFAEVIVRNQGAFAAQAAANGLTVVDTQTNQMITPDGAKAITDAYKQKYGADLAGLWTFNDTSAVGAASSVDDKFKPVIVSVNGQPEAIPLVKSGVIAATFDLQTDMLGRALAYAAIQALCGAAVPDTKLIVPVKLIDSTNVDAWRDPTERAKDDFEVTFEKRDGKTYLVTG